MIYVDYIERDCGVIVIKAINSLQNEETPYELTKLINSIRIQRLDIPYRILTNEYRPIIDSECKLTAFGKMIMKCLSNNMANPFQSPYMLRPSFEFVESISAETFDKRLEDILEAMRLLDPIYFFRNRAFIHKTVLYKILVYLSQKMIYSDGINFIKIFGKDKNSSQEPQVILFHSDLVYNAKGQNIAMRRQTEICVTQLIQMLKEGVMSCKELTIKERSEFLSKVNEIEKKNLKN